MRDHVKPHLGDLELALLSLERIEEWYVRLCEAGVTASLRHKVATTLGIALKDAVKRKLLHVNPISLVGKPRVITEEIRPLTGEEVGRFLQAAMSDKLYPLYVLALDTGMRQGELLALHGSELDLEGGTVRVLYSMERRGSKLRRKEAKTRASRRTIRITRTTIDVLRRGEPYKANGPIFSDRKGGHLRAGNLLRRSFNPITKKAGLEGVRFHDLRHTCATLLLTAGIHVKAVSQRLGHSDVMTTLRTYAHVLPGVEDRIIEVMQDVLGHRVSNRVSGSEGDLP